MKLERGWFDTRSLQLRLTTWIRQRFSEVWKFQDVWRTSLGLRSKSTRFCLPQVLLFSQSPLSSCTQTKREKHVACPPPKVSVRFQVVFSAALAGGKTFCFHNSDSLYILSRHLSLWDGSFFAKNEFKEVTKLKARALDRTKLPSWTKHLSKLQAGATPQKVPLFLLLGPSAPYPVVLCLAIFRFWYSNPLFQWDFDRPQDYAFSQSCRSTSKTGAGFIGCPHWKTTLDVMVW